MEKVQHLRIQQNNENSRDSKPKDIYFSKENKKFHFNFTKKTLSKNAKFSGFPENGILGKILQNKGNVLKSNKFLFSSHSNSIRPKVLQSRKEKNIFFRKYLFLKQILIYFWHWKPSLSYHRMMDLEC